jgi:hypothetical protein
LRSSIDGIIAKRADAPYRPGDDHSTVKISIVYFIDSNAVTTGEGMAFNLNGAL